MVLECAAEGIPDESSRDAIAQGDPDCAGVRHGGFEHIDRKLQQRSLSGSEHVGRVLGRGAIALLLHLQDLQFVRLENRRRQVHELDGLERNRQRADADLHGRCGLRGDAPAHEILDRRAHDRQRFVDRVRFGVIARIETHAALTGWQEDQAVPERAVQERNAQVGALDVESEHHARTPHVFQDLRILVRQCLEPAPRTLAGSPDLLEIQLVQQRDESHHAHRVSLPGRVELLLFLEERGQRLAHE